MNTTCPVCNNQIDPGEETCGGCGYRFLGATQSFHPVDLSDDPVVLTPKKITSTATLRVVRGPQIETIFHLKQEPLVVGRSPQSEIFLNDMTVSRKHAQIEPVGSGYEITDFNSYNGVWVNNESVDKHLLKEGDIIQVGAFCLLFEENH